MKRNIRITAAALCAALLFGAAAPVLAEGTSASAEKDETVYMVLNEDGSVRSQTVSVWLHDENGLAGAADRSSLSGLRTLKGEAMPEQAGNDACMECRQHRRLLSGHNGTDAACDRPHQL